MKKINFTETKIVKHKPNKTIKIMELYLFIWFIAIVFVLAVIQVFARYIQRVATQGKAIDKTITQAEKRETIVAGAAKLEKQNPNRWTYSELNLHKALLKGRRQGRERIVYHGTYYATGLKPIAPACQP